MPLIEYTFFGAEDRYRLIQKLGSGGFSEVWLAEDTIANNIQVALKVYASAGGLDDEGVKMFRHEFAVLFNYNHGNLLKPTHFDVYENCPYLVMQFCESGSAKRLVGKITENAAWKLLHDVSSGLSYLHDLNVPVIHQDIKPENILISNQCEFLITDFGISTSARSTLRKSAVNLHVSQEGGTVDYMGPERFGKKPEPVKASDIWALGVTMYELLEGRLPFAIGLGGMAQKGGAEIPDITGEYSKELKDIIRKMLAKEPWDRPTAEQIKKQTEGSNSNNSSNKWIKTLLIGMIAIMAIVGGYNFYTHLKDRPVSNKPFALHNGRNFTYTGEMKDRLPHGIGTAAYDSGTIAIKIEKEDDDVLQYLLKYKPNAIKDSVFYVNEVECTYKGRFANGYREAGGNAELTLKKTTDKGEEKESYVGGFRKNYRHGKGESTWENGDYFIGEFRYDLYWKGKYKKGGESKDIEAGKYPSGRPIN